MNKLHDQSLTYVNFLTHCTTSFCNCVYQHSAGWQSVLISVDLPLSIFYQILLLYLSVLNSADTGPHGGRFPCEDHSADQRRTSRYTNFPGRPPTGDRGSLLFFGAGSRHVLGGDGKYSASASLSPVSSLDNVFALPAEVFSSCLAIVSAVMVGGLFCDRPCDMELVTRQSERSGHQQRLLQAFTEDVFIFSLLVYIAH